MSYMFFGLDGLTSLDVSNWDTSNVTIMQSLFDCCHYLTSLDVSDWDTSNVTNMKALFGQCGSLASIDISKWNVSKVTTTDSMFYMCTSLTSIDVSNFASSSLTSTRNMFMGSTAISKITLSGFAFVGTDGTSAYLAYGGSWKAIDSSSTTTYSSVGLAYQTGTFIWSTLTPLTGSVSITGTGAIGQTLTATAANTPSGATLSYQWYRLSSLSSYGSLISGAIASTYTPSVSDVGSYLKCRVSGSSSTYVGALTSNSVQGATVPTLTLAASKATTTVRSNVTVTPTLSDAYSLLSTTPTWTSSNTAVATVSSTGVVSGISNGTVTITASYPYVADATKSVTAQTTVTFIGLAAGQSTVAGSGATKATYKVTSATAASYIKPASTSTKAVTVASSVTIYGKSYKVTSIGAKAFAKAKKLKKLTITSTNLTKAGVKNSLKSSKVTTVKVPKKKYSTYKKYFTKSNCGKSVTVKK